MNHAEDRGFGQFIDIHLPGIYVHRMVKIPPPPEGWWPQRPAEIAKLEAERSAR